MQEIIITQAATARRNLYTSHPCWYQEWSVWRCDQSEILGVTVSSKHVWQLVSRCAQSLHDVRILRSRGMEETTLYNLSTSWSYSASWRMLPMPGGIYHSGWWQTSSWGICPPCWSIPSRWTKYAAVGYWQWWCQLWTNTGETASHAARTVT